MALECEVGFAIVVLHVMNGDASFDRPDEVARTVRERSKAPRLVLERRVELLVHLLRRALKVEDLLERNAGRVGSVREGVWT